MHSSVARRNSTVGIIAGRIVTMTFALLSLLEPFFYLPALKLPKKNTLPGVTGAKIIVKGHKKIG